MVEAKLLKAFENKEETEIPVSFWHHYAHDEFVSVKDNPEILRTNIEGHQHYIQDVNPDFVKLMTDGYFQYPFENVTNSHDLNELSQIQNIADDHWWLKAQHDLVKQQISVIQGKYSFYNVFSPVTILKRALVNGTDEPLLNGDKHLADLYEQDPKLLQYVLGKIAIDIKKQIDVVIDAGADGIYYSTQAVQDLRTDNKEFFDSIQKPIDLAVISEINQKAPYNILHVCGFDEARNHLEWYVDYPLQIINWSISADGYSLKEGKQLFNDRVVLGGFGITTQDILYNGNKETIQNEVQRIIAETGSRGILIGADCTIQRNTPVEHIKWVEEAVHELTQGGIKNDIINS